MMLRLNLRQSSSLNSTLVMGVTMAFSRASLAALRVAMLVLELAAAVILILAATIISQKN